MEVLDLIYINENATVQELIDFSVGTPTEQDQVTRAGKYVERKIFIDIDKDIFLDENDVIVYDEDFKFIVLSILECYRVTKNIKLDMRTKKGSSVKIDDASETITRKDNSDMFMYKGIPCDEDTIAALLGYSSNPSIGSMTIDLSDVL